MDIQQPTGAKELRINTHNRSATSMKNHQHSDPWQSARLPDIRVSSPAAFGHSCEDAAVKSFA
jgi:hypothetical protein